MPVVLQWITRIIPARYYVSSPEKDISQGDADRFALHRPGSSGAVRARSGTARHRLIPQEVGVKEDKTMLVRLKQMLIKEFIQVFRDKRTRFLLFGPPIIQMLIFGYAATFEIHHVPTVVLDLDHSQESRELISRFSSSPYFDVQRQLTDYRQVRDLIDQGKATIGLEIHAGFAQNLRKGQTAPLQVIVDATNSNTRPDRLQLHHANRTRLRAGLPEGPHLPHRAANAGRNSFRPTRAAAVV